MNSKIMPTTYFLILLILSIVLHFVFPIVKFIHFPFTLIGILFIIFGIVLNLWTDQMFKTDKTAVKPHLKPTTLETNGPFRITRHPMYLGMFAILFGTAIMCGSIISFFPPLLFIIITEIIFIPMEEKNLEQAFQQDYIDYKNNVRRWI